MPPPRRRKRLSPSHSASVNPFPLSAAISQTSSKLLSSIDERTGSSPPLPGSRSLAVTSKIASPAVFRMDARCSLSSENLPACQSFSSNGIVVWRSILTGSLIILIYITRNVFEKQVVYVTEGPFLTGLDRPDNGMSDRSKMLCRMSVGRRIAAPNVPAIQTHPEMNPPRASTKAVFTSFRASRNWPKVLEMAAIIHPIYAADASDCAPTLSLSQFLMSAITISLSTSASRSWKWPSYSFSVLSVDPA